MSLYFDRNGNELIDAALWAGLMADDDYRRVASTVVGKAHVSTVWLGLDHQFGEGPPLIFETMVFGGDLDQHQWRYSTEAQAVEGHDRVVTLLRDKKARRVMVEKYLPKRKAG